MMIAEKKFVINNSRERIWDLMLKAVLRFMPFERMQVLSEKTFHALLRVKIGFVSLPMDVDIKIVDISPSESLTTVIKAKGMRDMIWLNQKSTFTLIEIGGNKTEITCELEENGMSRLLKVFFLPKVRSFTRDAFNNFEELLRQWA